jgi:predicted DCC family thiol-disulfide oxidoreductase YuxK
MRNPEQEHQEMEVFYDGDCPVCSREVRFLRRQERLKSVRFVDIDSLGDRAVERADRSRDQLMERIHGRMPDGTVIEGVEVFRRLYDQMGWRVLVAPTRWPLLRQISEAAYGWFARNRQRITGRAK